MCLDCKSEHERTCRESHKHVTKCKDDALARLKGDEKFKDNMENIYRWKCQTLFKALNKVQSKEEIERLMKLGIMTPEYPGHCAFASPPVLISTKNATSRMCVYFRPLTEQPIKDDYTTS